MVKQAYFSLIFNDFLRLLSIFIFQTDFEKGEIGDLSLYRFY
jgi:hypothetical protein